MTHGNAHLAIEHVQVETSSWCNRDCEFCPNAVITQPKELMPRDLYRRILAELAAQNFAGRFSPYLRNEPLLDKRLPTLIADARAALPEALIFLNSNGDALNLSRAFELYESGLDSLILSAYDKKSLTALLTLLPQIQRTVRDLHICVADFQAMIEPRRPGEPRRIAMVDATEWRISDLSNRAGNVLGAARPRQPLNRSCFRPFKQLYVTYLGEVVLCCCDWRAEVVFGDLRNTTIAEAFNSPTASFYREKLGRAERDMKLCNVCDFSGSYGKAARPGADLVQIRETQR